ncbi:MAG TPA: VWA domain-containing protein [Gemmataceae bacterium]|jgi:uncharacterized membrane protein|nr:VWA domain-containing protein [Gemmataceae bacterium]
MGRLIDFLASHWFGLFLLAAALASGLLLVGRRRRGTVPLALLVVTIALVLAGLGGLISTLVDEFHLQETPAAWAWWVTIAALTVLSGMLVILLLSGWWSARLGCAVTAVLLLGVGGIAAGPVGRELVEAGKVLVRVEFVQPWWLLLLALLPVIVWLSFRSLAGLGPVRRWVAIGLRCLLVLMLTLALAETRLRHQNENVTVLFLVDRSLSIPEEFEPDPRSPGTRVDRRWERIKDFINRSVASRGPGHERDKVGVIVFGRQPRLELPPGAVPRLNFYEVASTIDNTYTDIGAAIKLALASFPEGTGKRIVLLSDGNENLGNALEQAKIAHNNGVQIDVVPLAAGYRNENEVMVQGVEAPAHVEQNSSVLIRVLVRSSNPRVVYGSLTLNQLVGGDTLLVGKLSHARVVQGLNPFFFKKSLVKQAQESFTYEAIFEPEGVEDEQGHELPEATATLKKMDRVQNNRATTHVIASGRRRILVIIPWEGESEFLIEHLRKVGKSKYTVHTILAEALPQNSEELAVFLSSYDCVILDNVAASDVAEGKVEEKVPAAISDEQQEVLRSNTHDQGCGLIMIGGPNSFGAGGWRNTPVEKALPVDCDIKSLQVTGKGGLVLIMHASEIYEGNRWQKEVAKLAIKKLSSLDMLGMIYYDWQQGGHRWHIPFQLVGEKRNEMLRLVDRMSPGDMPDVDPALQQAFDALTNPKHELTTRHIIFISDGDHWQANPALLAKLRGQKITCSTVCITSHGFTEEQKMNAVAIATGGRFYNVKSAKALPAIYTKETRIVSQSFLYEKPFQPRLVPLPSGPTANLPARLRRLHGYVRTSAKDSRFVQTPILAPRSGEQDFPILAYWHYGLGKAVAFTSDARSKPGLARWDREWASSDMYLKFWEQVVDWSLRAVETGELVITSEYSDGKVKVIIDAQDTKNPKNPPLTGLQLEGRVTPPSAREDDARKLVLHFEEKNSGHYEAEFKAEEAGSYFIHATAQEGDKVYGVRSGVTIPYSPEFADMESNTPLMDRLREMTDGETFADNDEALAEAAGSPSRVFRLAGLPPSRSLQPVWYWLLLFTGVGLFFDVAVRRIAIDPSEASVAARRLWGRLRGQAPAAEETPQFLDRLKSRKAQIGESLERTRAAQRFDAGGGPAVAPPGADQPSQQPARQPPPRPAPQQRVGPEAEQEAADYASRLLRAKKRVWQDRDKDKDK